MKFTVIMPIHDFVEINLLKKAINSIFKSSKLPNELLLMIDGNVSKEKKNYLRKLKKRKIVKIVYKKKIGITKILNKSLKIAKYDLIARADSDDINHKLRFEKQIKYYQNNDVDILGTNIFEIYKKKRILKNMPLQPNLLSCLFKNPINHMTVMFSKKKIIALGGYPDIKYKEDYALWIIAFCKKYKIKNIKEPLVSANINLDTVSRRKNIEAIKSEFLLTKLIFSQKILLLPISIFSIILRVLFLLLPSNIYLFVKKTINS